MLSLAARRQLPNRPFLAQLRDLINSDPRTPDGAPIVRWTDVGAGGFVVLEPEALAALFPVWFPARSEMPWNRRRQYLFGHFVDDVLGYGFDIEGGDYDSDEDESITFTHGLFGPASGPDQFRQIARINSYARRRMSPASVRRHTLLGGGGGAVPLRRIASGRFRVSRAGEARRAQYREERERPARERAERARAAQQQSEYKQRLDCLARLGFICILLLCVGLSASSLLWRLFFSHLGEMSSPARALLLVLGLVTKAVSDDQGRHVFDDPIPTRLATFSKETGRFAGLFALFGSFPALFGLGLVFFCVALDRWLSKTGRDDHVVPTIILIIGFAVGYWWQGRVAEGAGLFALQFGVLLVLDRLRI